MNATESRKVHIGVYGKYTSVCMLQNHKVHMGVYATQL